ncbi:MAG: bacteriophage holin [Gammaproteobacteria bacterium]|nr:bacteriophage holin [Gammaproteobacteria bacterium]
MSKGRRLLSLGLALGITWALIIFFLGVMAMLSGHGLPMVKLWATIYYGYSASWFGSVIGAVWAFVDLFVISIVAGFLYQLFVGE